MSPMRSEEDGPPPRATSNVYTVLMVLASIFLAGGITLLYLTLMPYLPAQ
jgi:hypothetical protein